MVVVIESCILQLFGLLVVEHAQRGTGFHAQRAHFPDHLQHGRHVLLGGLAPGRAHAEAPGAGLLGCLGGLHHFVQFQHLLVLDRGMERGLRAVAAVFGTAAGLDRQQGGKLHRIRVEMFAVHLLCEIHQVGEGQLEQSFYLFNAPMHLFSLRFSEIGSLVLHKCIST